MRPINEYVVSSSISVHRSFRIMRFPGAASEQRENS